jgi:hypothetical protein
MTVVFVMGLLFLIALTVVFGSFEPSYTSNECRFIDLYRSRPTFSQLSTIRAMKPPKPARAQLSKRTPRRLL